jgi:hypothetical protein
MSGVRRYGPFPCAFHFVCKFCEKEMPPNTPCVGVKPHELSGNMWDHFCFPDCILDWDLCVASVGDSDTDVGLLPDQSNVSFKDPIVNNDDYNVHEKQGKGPCINENSYIDRCCISLTIAMLILDLLVTLNNYCFVLLKIFPIFYLFFF